MADQLTPDDKDWTWVLHSVCPECNFDVSEVELRHIGALIRSNAGEWTTLLAGDPELVRTRTEPAKWSTLEYAAHVRDVHRLYLERLELMLTLDGPRYPNWDQDETAIVDDYGSQDPALVVVGLRDAASALADRFDTVEGDDWNRTGYRSDGAAFTIESFARYLVHDPVHHLWDVTGLPG